MKFLSLFIGLVLGTIATLTQCASPDASHLQPQPTPTSVIETRPELRMLHNPVYNDVCYYVQGKIDTTFRCLSVD